MEKRTVLYLIPHLQNQGPVVQLLNLVSHLDRNTYSPFIITLYNERHNSLITAFQELNIPVHCLDTKKWQVMTQRRKLEKKIIEIDPDIIHSNSALTDGLCASIDTDKPIILTLHNYMYEDIIVQYGIIVGNYICNREKKAILKADTVITCSNTLKHKYEESIPRGYIAITNGIDIEKWNSDPENSCVVRARFGIPEDAFVFISTGALIERKNPKLIIESFYAASIDNSYLLIVGDGSLAEECKHDSSGNVIFTGRVGNVKDYLYASDAFISASRSEGLPYAVLEAECTGIKLALSDIPQHREALGDNADMAFFFPVDDKDELVRAIELVAKQGKSRLHYRADDFSAASMSQKYQMVYERVGQR